MSDLKGKPIKLPWGGDAADIIVERMRRAGCIARSADRDVASEIIRTELRARDAALRDLLEALRDLIPRAHDAPPELLKRAAKLLAQVEGSEP